MVFLVITDMLTATMLRHRDFIIFNERSCFIFKVKNGTFRVTRVMEKDILEDKFNALEERLKNVVSHEETRKVCLFVV